MVELKTKNLKKNPFDEAEQLNKGKSVWDLAQEKPDFGMIALPREKLPGVWDYDKQLDQLLGDPGIDIEKMMPLDVRYDFGRIVGMTEKPDETKDKMATSLFYSVELGIPPSVSFSILDELNKIAFDGKIPASTAWGRIKQRYRTGKAEVQLMDMGFDILKGTWQDWEKYDRSVKNIEKLRSGMTVDQRKEFRSFFEKLIGASVELAPFGLEAAKEMPLGAGIGGTLFGIGAALATAAIPTVGEEVPAVTAAVLTGMKLGAGVRGAIRVGQLEAGGMFLELANMKDQYGNRIDPRIAIVASHAVGAINGGIELAEWFILASTFGIGKKLFDKSVRKVTHRLFTQGTLKELIARKALDYSIALGTETLQEIEQETTNVIFGELAKELNDAREGTDFKPISAEDLKARYREVTVESMRAFGLMVLPGTTISGALELVAQKKAGASVKAEKPGIVEVKAPVEIPAEIAEMTDDQLYERFRATKITEPEWKPLYEEVVRRKEVEKAPSKPAEVAEIPPKAAEAKPVAKAEPTEKQEWKKTYEKAENLYVQNTKASVKQSQSLLEAMPTNELLALDDARIAKGDLDAVVRQELAARYNDLPHEYKLKTNFEQWQQFIREAQPPAAEGNVEELKKQGYTAEQAELIIRNREGMLDIKSPGVQKVLDNPQDYTPIGGTGNIAVFRVSEKGGKLTAGQFVFTSKDDAIAFRDEFGFERGQPDIIEKVVDKSDLRNTKDNDPSELIYFPKSLAQPPAAEAVEVAPEAGEKLTAREGYTYRAIGKASDAVGKDVSMARSTVDWYEGDGFLLEFEGKAGKAIPHHPGAYRGDLTGAEVSRVYYEPGAYVEEYQKDFYEELGKLKKQFPDADFIPIEIIEGEKGLEYRIAQPPAAEAAKVEKAKEPTEPAKVIGKKEAPGLTVEEQKEYKRLKEIESIMRKKGLVAIAKESADRRRIVELEKKMALAEATKPEQAKLRQKIHAIAIKKGLTKKALEDLKKKHTGYRHLTGKISKAKITTEQLQNLLKAVQKARPKQVGYKKVITRKTEKKIQSLKENLIKKTQMTERHFDEILEIEVHGKEPKYTDAKNFITETQGKDILRRMLDTAEIVRLTESFEQAIAKNPEITDRVKLLDSRIAKSPKRDPYSLESMRYYNQQAEVKTGAPIFTSYMDLMDTHLEITKTRTATWKRLENTTEKFKEIAKDKKALQRVSDYIASQSTLKEKPAMPEDITVDETKLAKEIQKILEEYRIKVRVAKFYNWYYYNQPIPDHDRYTREITKAVDIYESKGKEELIEYLETQEWGVIHSGYEPLEILFHKIRPYTTGPTAVGKGHIKIRTDIEYHKQERNILQRLSAYMRQIDTLYNLSPKINAYVRLFDDNAGKFKEWDKVKNDIEIFLRNLKRYNIEGGFFERMIARAYSQAMRVIIMPSPILSFRNLFQNAAFEHDKSILIDTRNTKLTDSDIEYLETYVLQTRSMVEEYFMVGEKPLPGLRFLTKLIDKVKLYPYSDIANRHWSFWAKTNQVDRALKAESVKQMMTEAKFEDMTELEQRRSLAILVRDGKEAMTQYVGRVHVDDIHFLYERSQRSPAEMTSLGKIVGNLMLFPRAYGEKLAHASNKTLKGKTYQEQWRGLKTLFAVIGGGTIVGSIYCKVTGRKRNPYNPLEILAFRPGGLAWGSVEAATEVYANILSAAKGDSRALAALTVAIPRAADIFIPFYDYTLRAIEAATDQKNIDRKVLRQMRMMIDKEYKIRGGAYKVKRNALEKWQYFISGPSAEKEEKKQKPKKITR